MLTAYDVVFARLADGAGIDVVLVGDSLGMVVQGERSTLGVTLDEMVYHTRIVVARDHPRAPGRRHAVHELPGVDRGRDARRGRLMKEGHAEAVKLEGGEEVAELARRLVRAGIPVMGHVGLTPQSIHQLGGFKVQGRTDAAAYPDPGRRARARRRGRLRRSCWRRCRTRWPARSRARCRR